MHFSIIILGNLLANTNIALLYNINLQQPTRKQYFHSTLVMDEELLKSCAEKGRCRQ